MSRCPYCGAEVVLKEAYEVYGTERSKKYPKMWVCSNFPKCDAYVGCHEGTDIPMGRLANARLRTLKMEAHKQVDVLWKSGLMSRREAYRWLADMMNMELDDCHIGMFDIKRCQQVIHLCRKQDNEVLNRFRSSNFEDRKPHRRKHK